MWKAEMKRGNGGEKNRNGIKELCLQNIPFLNLTDY